MKRPTPVKTPARKRKASNAAPDAARQAAEQVLLDLIGESYAATEIYLTSEGIIGEATAPGNAAKKRKKPVKKDEES